MEMDKISPAAWSFKKQQIFILQNGKKKTGCNLQVLVIVILLSTNNIEKYWCLGIDTCFPIFYLKNLGEENSLFVELLRLYLCESYISGVIIVDHC